MRIGTILLIIWLIIGAVAAGQRHYSAARAQLRQGERNRRDDYRGPLNYVGVNPKVSCKAST